MKLLIVSPDAYSVFHTGTSFIFGGIEVETGHHAAGLTALGMDVHVCTRDQGVAAHRVNGVTLHPIAELKGKGYWEKRTSLAGKIKYRLAGDKNDGQTLEALFAQVKPDAGYIMGMSREALRLARYCKLARIPFFFRAAHDKDFGDDGGSDKAMQGWALMSMAEAREVIETATCVIAQTPFQSELYLKRFNRDSQLMFPPIVLDSDSAPVEKEYDVFWIGRTNSFKRPEIFSRIATHLKHRKFCMVLNKASDEEWNAIVSGLPSNVKVIESVPATEMDSYFRRSKVFLSTSLHEGFPNTFLQAGKNGVPVVSMGSDPNRMLSLHGAGFLVGDDQQVAQDRIEELLNSNTVYEACAAASMKYVAAFHDRNLISKQLFDILMQHPV